MTGYWDRNFETSSRNGVARCALAEDGTMDTDRVLRDYCYGDEDTQTILFLAYRDLRHEFMKHSMAASIFPESGAARRMSMKMSSVSMMVFAVYLFFLGLIFLIIPNPVISFFGVPPTSEVWIRILGCILALLAFYYFMAVHEKAKNFYRWSVYGRLPILPMFAALVLTGVGPKIILLFGVFDLGCAMWTWFTLKNEARELQSPGSSGVIRV